MCDYKDCDNRGKIAREVRNAAVLRRYCYEHDPLNDDSVSEFFAVPIPPERAQ